MKKVCVSEMPKIFSTPIYVASPPEPPIKTAEMTAEYFRIEQSQYDLEIKIWAESQSAHINKIREEKLQLLAKHHGLSHSMEDGSKLAMLLAVQFMSGFQAGPAPKPAGAKQKWNEMRYARLANDVRRYQKRNPNHSVGTACKHLAKKEPWRSLDMNERTLANRYSKWQRRFWRFRGVMELMQAGVPDVEIAAYLMNTDNITEIETPILV